MTDLEKFWDDLPVGPAPVDAILREARQRSGRQAGFAARRRPEARLKRSLAAVTVLGGIAAAFVTGTLVSQPGATGPGSAGPGSSGPGSAGPAGPGGVAAPGPTPVAFHGELQAPASCDELLAHYVERGVDLVSRYGWGGDGLRRLGYDSPLDLAALPDSATVQFAERSTAPKTAGAPASESGTNVQEQGVDEPDSVKTDGQLLVRLREATLTAYDVTGDEIRELGSLDLGDFHDGEILLAGDTVVALGNDGTRPTGVGDHYGAPSTSPQTRVLSVDLTDPSNPALEQTVDYDAELVAARQHGSDVRLVLSKGLPDLDFEDGSGARAANRALVEATTIDDWLPQMSVDGDEPTPLLDCARVALPRAELGLATMAVVGFGSTSPDDVEALGLAGDAPLTYESSDHLYLASSGGFAGGFDGGFARCLGDCFPGGGSFDGTTHVYDFELDGTRASYVGAGEVEGTVRDRWSMDEHDGVLRVAVGPSSETGNYNSIVTLQAQDDALVEIGRIDRLGVGEDIKAVRWFDDLALLVTFRQIDPLYAVDLGDQRAPTLLGELKIPGFSSYLHPLGTMRVVGVGTAGGRGGAQAGLFDVTDLSDLRRLDTVEYGVGTYARASDDPRQFTWLPDQRIVLTVIARGRTGFVSKVQLDGGSMTNEMTQVEFGNDVDDVRLVPLPDGKVALVTGEDVAYFPLG